VHVAFCVNELGAQRVGKSPQRALRAAIRRLQRYRPISERGADLHYRAAVARLHAFERCLRSPHRAKIRHFGCPPEILRRNLENIAENRGHRVVDPHVDSAPFALDALGRRLDLSVIGDIRGNDHRDTACALDIPPGAFQTFDAAGQ
jgi:hypothetical protein